MSTGGFGATWIAVEAKRFQSPKGFERKELLGELLELPDDIDLWVLASTVRVPDQIISSLREKAAKRGLAIDTLDASPDQLGDLPALCAASEDVIVPFLAGIVAGRDLGKLLSAIRRHPDFSAVMAGLRDRFSAGSIGYAQARAASHTYLRSAFEDASQARVALGQAINVLENGGRHVVERRQALDALESWRSGWPAAPKPFVLLGEEGMGKTWALASWLARRLDASDPAFPLTLFLPSWAVGTFRALDLIADALATCTGVREAGFWSRRAEAFAQRSSAICPALLLVLDGLNEQPLFDWRTLLESLQVSPWKDQVATVLTCRPAYWHEELASQFQSSLQIFEVGPYDEGELASALEKGRPQTDNLLPSTLEPLLRKPRYFDLTVKHRPALEQSGDMTVDRLLYEDWKDRIARKKGLFSDDDFRSLLTQLAERHRDGLLSKRDVQDLVPHRELLTGLDEIITGGILVRDSLGRYSVEPRRLIQGLGLLLADQVKNVSNQGESARRELMAAFLEPHADMDRKVAVCRSAVTFAVLEPDFPESARSALFEQWIGSRNLSREDIESFTAYLPASTSSYLHLVERFWTKSGINRQAQTLLVRAFCHWRDNLGVQKDLAKACERWLSYVHPCGYWFMRGNDDASRAELRRKIEERAGQPLRPGDKILLVDELEVTEDDHSLRLSEPALLLASLFSAEPFVPALRRWALSRSVIGHPEEAAAVAWMLRQSGEDLWPAIEAAVGPLLDGSRVAQQAVWQLLWACGREEAASVLDRLPQDLFPPSFEEEMYSEDPCQMSWRREDCSMCAARADLSDSIVALTLAPHALDPNLQICFDLRPRLKGALSGIRTKQLLSGPEMTMDDGELQRIEPTLAAFAPDLLADAYRALVRDLPNRTTKSRPVLLSRLDAMTLLLEGRDEQRVLREDWERVCRTEKWDDNTRHEEGDLIAAILFRSTAKVQLDLLLRRPKHAFPYVTLGSCFKKMPPKALRILAQSLLESPLQDLWRKLWFLCYQPAGPVVAVLGAEQLVDLLEHADREIRSIAEEWLFLSGSDEVFDLAIERGLVVPQTTRFMHQRWGRRFAVRMRSRLPYERLARAFDLGSLSYVIRERPQDLNAYARDLDQAVRAVTSTRDETFKTWFCEQTLKAILSQDRPVVEGWVLLAVRQRDAWPSPLIESCHMMLESLCEVLLETVPEQGEELFETLMAQRRHAKTIDYPTRVDVLALTLFRLPRSEHADRLLHEWLDDCITDKNLFELALAASAVGNDDRLGKLIQQGISSPVLVKRAAALTLAGFAVHGSESAALLESAQFHPEGWLCEVQRLARWRLDRDRWAQEWFRRFTTSSNVEEAFAAFRLFLLCVDRRYWTWRDPVVKDARSRSDRRRYLAVSRDEIDRAIKENEKELEKRFLGHKIAEDEVHPWLKRYLG